MIPNVPYKVTLIGPQLQRLPFTKNCEDCVVAITDGKNLPRLENLKVLHSPHANNSSPMIWEEGSGTFKCVHCGKRVRFSAELYSKLLADCSSEKFVGVQDTATQVVVALDVRRIPVLARRGQIFAIRQ